MNYNTDHMNFSTDSKFTIGLDERGHLVYGNPINIQGLSSEEKYNPKYENKKIPNHDNITPNEFFNGLANSHIPRESLDNRSGSYHNANNRSSSANRSNIALNKKKSSCESLSFVDKSEDKIDYSNFMKSNTNWRSSHLIEKINEVRP